MFLFTTCSHGNVLHRKLNYSLPIKVPIKANQKKHLYIVIYTKQKRKKELPVTNHETDYNTLFLLKLK